MTATDLPVAGDQILPNLQGTHFQLAPEWSHVTTPTIAALAYVFTEPVRVVRGGAWLAGDEIEYLKDDDEIPATLLDPILLHLAEVWERKHGWTQPNPAGESVRFSEAITWMAGDVSHDVWPRLKTFFEPAPLGGYWLRGSA